MEHRRILSVLAWAFLRRASRQIGIRATTTTAIVPTADSQGAKELMNLQSSRSHKLCTNHFLRLSRCPYTGVLPKYPPPLWEELVQLTMLGEHMNFMERLAFWNAELPDSILDVTEIEPPRVGQYREQETTRGSVLISCLLSDNARDLSQNSHIFFPVRTGESIGICSPTASLLPYRLAWFLS